MQIDSIDVYQVALPLREPHPTKAGEIHAMEIVLVRMQSGDVSGWGESSPGNAPLAGAEWSAGAFGCVRDWLAPRLAGKSIDSGEDLQAHLALFRGNQFAKAALDTAWWDLRARLKGQPLHQILGGKRDAIEVGVSFDQKDSIDDLLAEMARAFEQGYARVEVKMRPGWDLNMLGAVRHEFPTQTVHADIEAALTLNDMEILYRIDDFALAMVEQPLAADDLVGHAMVQEAIRTPVCLDEAITTTQQAEIALELTSGKYVNVKVGRVGGLTPALAIHDLCHDACTPCFVGSPAQSAIGARLDLALAAKENFSYPADYHPPEGLCQEDLAHLPNPVRDESTGTRKIPLWSEPGIGVEPRVEAIQRYQRAHARLP